jgi:hypothetical protein
MVIVPVLFVIFDRLVKREGESRKTEAGSQK